MCVPGNSERDSCLLAANECHVDSAAGAQSLYVCHADNVMYEPYCCLFLSVLVDVFF